MPRCQTDLFRAVTDLLQTRSLALCLCCPFGVMLLRQLGSATIFRTADTTLEEEEVVARSKLLILRAFPLLHRSLSGFRV